MLAVSDERPATTSAAGRALTSPVQRVLQIADLDNIGGNTGGLVFAVGTLQLGVGYTDDFSTRTVTFLQEVWAELKKVHWPSRKETYAATAVVLVVVGIVALYLGMVDFALSQIIQVILR